MADAVPSASRAGNQHSDGAAAPTEGEAHRRQVAVLFADMADFTAATERLGEEEHLALARQVAKAMMEPVHAHGGSVQEYGGDGIWALFGAPTALEEAAVSACRAAMDIQARVGNMRVTASDGTSIDVRVRIGLNSGPIVVGRIGDDRGTRVTALGDTVNVAARLQAMAEPASIVMSESMYRNVAGLVECDDLGIKPIRGRQKPARLFRVRALQEQATRFDRSLNRGLSDLVGRENELAMLREAWRQVGATGMRFIDICGEAGLGKSRILHELRAGIDRSCTVLRGQGRAQGQGVPLWPFVDALRRFCRIAAQSSPDAIAAATAACLNRAGIAGEEVRYLARLLGGAPDLMVDRLDSGLLGQRTRAAMVTVVATLARHGPTLLVIDDAHWIDRTSEELLSTLRDELADLPLLVVRAYRPGYVPVPGAGAPVMELRPLSAEATARMIRSRLPNAATLPALRLLIRKAEGNPLFIEELLEHLGETGVVCAAAAAGDAPVHLPHLPATLEHLLIQRVDRLSASTRQLLQQAAIIGRRFQVDLLRELASSDSFAADLAQLEAHRLIYPEGPAPIERFRFKHALLQDAVYDGMLPSRRAALHGVVAETYLRLHPERAAAMADVLARHFEQAGDRAAAIRHHIAAGERSLSLHAIDIAYLHLTRALRLIDVDPASAEPPAVGALALALGRVLYHRGACIEAAETLQRLLPIIESTVDQAIVARVLFHRGFALTLSASEDKGVAAFERVRALAQATGDQHAGAYAALGFATVNNFWIRPGQTLSQETVALCAQALQEARTAGDIWLEAMLLNCLAQNGAVHGNPVELRHHCDALERLADRTGHPLPRSLALLQLSSADANSKATDQAIARASEALRLAMAPLDRMMADAYIGVALAAANRGAEALEHLRRSRDNAERLGNVRVLLIADLSYGASLVMTGSLSRGVRFIEATRHRFAAWGYITGQAMCHLVLGEGNLRLVVGAIRPPLPVLLRNVGFLLRRKPFAAFSARYHLDRAERLYREFEAPSWLAWVLLDKGLLAQRLRRFDDARRHLDEAAALATAVGAPGLLDKIEAVRQSLEPAETAR